MSCEEREPTPIRLDRVNHDTSDDGAAVAASAREEVGT